MYDFTLNLGRRLTPAGNLVWSPYSVASALALVATGARGRTYAELTGALGAAPGDLRLAEGAALEDAEIAVANSLWTQKGLPIEEEYERVIAGLPGAARHGAGFAADPERAREAINADVAKTTRELIKELLSPGAIRNETRCVLVNALYLKIAWLKPFGERATRPGTFHAPDGPREVPMMRQTERLPYAEVGGWRMVTLPAAGGGVVADVLLGDAETAQAAEQGPDQAAAPSPALLRSLYDSARSTRVALSLPRFRVEASTSLRDPLRQLGMVSAFGPGADFSGISPEPLVIDRIEHKAVLDVDEEGFEGAAATAVVMVLAAMDMGTPLEFRVDRPFLMIVRRPATEAVYFVARVTEPAGT